jgi:hypothetical protein
MSLLNKLVSAKDEIRLDADGVLAEFGSYDRYQQVPLSGAVRKSAMRTSNWPLGETQAEAANHQEKPQRLNLFP